MTVCVTDVDEPVAPKPTTGVTIQAIFGESDSSDDDSSSDSSSSSSSSSDSDSDADVTKNKKRKAMGMVYCVVMHVAQLSSVFVLQTRPLHQRLLKRILLTVLLE